MSARVYLMADFGKGPIKRVNCSDPVLGGMLARCAKAEARRWWLVEAESARAARTIIAEAGTSRERVQVMMGPHLIAGRILDSGGAQ